MFSVTSARNGKLLYEIVEFWLAWSRWGLAGWAGWLAGWLACWVGSVRRAPGDFLLFLLPPHPPRRWHNITSAEIFCFCQIIITPPPPWQFKKLQLCRCFFYFFSSRWVARV